jgi:tRNA-guanine family transglycosylase
MRLAALHNVAFILELVKDIRRSIERGEFSEFKQQFLKTYQNNEQSMT